MELGKNIYTLRKSKGMSQEKLAEKVGVTRQTVSNWELGETAPNPRQLVLLSAALDKSIDELVGNTQIYKKTEYDEIKTVKDIYSGFAVLFGVFTVIWAFSANRFRNSEILLMGAAGAVMGSCVALIFISALKYLRNKKV